MNDSTGLPASCNRAEAYSVLEQQLDGAVAFGVRRRNGLTTHLFSTGNGSIAVVWSERERRFAVEGARVLDLMGNEMMQPVLHSGEPVYVVAPQLPCGQLEPLLNSALTAND